MEEKPPTQAGRDVPRSRTPRNAFGTPDQPTPPSKPAERAPRRSEAAPAVTFQAAANDESTSPEAAPRKPTQRRSESGQGPAKKTPPAAKATPPDKATPLERATAKATPPAKAAAKAAPETAAPAKHAAKAAPPAKKAAAEPATVAPAKRAPKKVPATPGDAIGTVQPGDKGARAKKASARKPQPTDHLDAVPAQPAADATPPAKAMPINADPATAMPTNADPATAMPINADPATAMPTNADEAREAEQPQPTIVSRLTADPGHAPELLALAAVQTIGPRAKEWAKRTREAYPKATDAAIARLAADQFTRLTSPTSIVTALAGSYAPSTLIATTALTHARVILHVAAAYGMDPTDEARAADLLVLTRIQPSRENAEAALAVAKQQQTGEQQQTAADTVQRIARMVAANAAGWVAVKLISRYFPGTSLLAAALVSRSSARNMAERANTHYSQASHALGSSV